MKKMQATENTILNYSNNTPPSASNCFSVDSVGTGSFTGLSYEVPAHTSGLITTYIQTMALTSNDIIGLNTLIMSLLQASKRDKVLANEKISASGDISFWHMVSAGAKVGYEKNHR